jgi:hypothetical protein
MKQDSAILYPNLVGGDSNDPTALVLTCHNPPGIITVQASNDDALRALVDRMIDDPEAMRGLLLVARAQMSKSN